MHLKAQLEHKGEEQWRVGEQGLPQEDVQHIVQVRNPARRVSQKGSLDRFKDRNGLLPLVMQDS